MLLVLLTQPRSVEEIFRRLRADDSPVARDILREMEKRSPIALKVSTCAWPLYAVYGHCWPSLALLRQALPPGT